MRPEGYPETADRATVQHVARILAELAQEIEALGVRLRSDPTVLRAHADTLQSIDMLSQRQHWLAMVLRAGSPSGAIDAIGLEVLRDEPGGSSTDLTA